MANDGYIDLGVKMEPLGTAAKKDSAPKVIYPTMHISHKISDGGGLNDLPDGEFSFTAKGQVVSYSENKKAGTCSCEIEITAIKPDGSKAKKPAPAEDGLDKALTKIAKKKNGMPDPSEAMDSPAEDAADMAEGD